MGVTPTRILEIQNVYRRLLKTSWKTFVQTRESDGTMIVDFGLFDSKDGMGTVQNLDCLLLLLLLLQASPNRE
jgi:hypothetical protein